MAIDIDVRGRRALERLARNLKHADKVVTKELYQGLGRVAKPAKQRVVDDIPRHMPSGYAPSLQRRLKQRHRFKRGANPTLLITGVRVSRLEAGVLRHPTFGHRPWVNQRVKPGFYTTPLRLSARRILREFEVVAGNISRKIERQI